jgi:hypothetical protein
MSSTFSNDVFHPTHASNTFLTNYKNSWKSFAFKPVLSTFLCIAPNRQLDKKATFFGSLVQTSLAVRVQIHQHLISAILVCDWLFSNEKVCYMKKL